MDRDYHLAKASELGRIVIAGDAVAQLVGHVAAESYGIVGMSAKGRLPRVLSRDKLTDGIEVRAVDGGLAIDLHVVVEHGLNLSEVASTFRTRVAYEVERQTGLKVAGVEVHIEGVRRSP